MPKRKKNLYMSSQTYEEIDLLQLIVKIYNFFKRYFWIIVGITITIVIGGTVGMYFVLKPHYQSSMIVISRSMSASEFIGVTEAFNRLIKEKNWKEIQKLTTLDISICRTLRKIEAASNREVQKNVDKELIKDYTISLTIETTDNSYFTEIQKGLLHYYENLPYVEKKKQLFIKARQQTLERVRKNIRHLDSLQKIIESAAGQKNNLTIIFGSNNNFSSGLLELYETENKLIEELAFPEDIRVIKDLTTYEKPIKFSFTESLFVSFTLGFFIGILIALTKEFRRLYSILNN